MAGYQPSQDGIYISPDTQIPPGMTEYPTQPPTIPRQQQQMSNRLPLPQQQIGNYFMPPPPPPQYRHHTTASGPPPSNYPYPPQPTQLPPPLQQQQQFRNTGSTTVMLPVTFTPGMAPVIHSAAATNTAGIQQRQPQFHGPPPPMNNDRYTMNTTTERGGNPSGGGGGAGSAGSAGVAASPRYLSMGNPPPSMLPNHPFASQTHPSAGQMWQGGVPGAPPAAVAAPAAAVAMGRMSPPHPLTYSGQDFQATMPSVGVTGPLQIPRIQARQQQTPAAVCRVSPLAAFQPPPPPPPLLLVRPEEQSGDSAPRRSYPSSGEHGAVVARKRAQPFNNHGFKSQNNDLAEDTLEIPLPSSLVTAAVTAARPVTVPKMHNNAAHELGIEALVEAATAADPEVSRASRSSARQQRNKKLNQNEVLMPPGGGGSGERPKGGPGNASEKLRRELGAALLGGDAGDVAAAPAAVGPPPVFQQQQQPTVPSSVLQNLSRALADLSRMTAGTTPAVEATAAAAATMPTNRTLPLPPVQLPPPPPSSQIPPVAVASPIQASPPGKSLQRKKNLEKDHGGEQGGKGKAAPPAGATTTTTKSKSTTDAPPPPSFDEEEEKEEIEVVVPDNKLCPACGKTFIHRSSKTRHMKNCKAVALGLVYKAPRKKKKAAAKKKKPKDKPPAPEQPAAPSPPLLPEPPAPVAPTPVAPAPVPPPPPALPPPPPRPPILAPFIIPTIPHTLTRPANGNKVSQPLKPEKIYFGPGIFFPRPLKRKRSNIFKKIGPFGGSSGGAMPNSGFYWQQRFMVQQQQQPPPYYLPIRPPPPSLQNFRPAFGAPYNNHQHQQPQYPLFPTAANAGGGAAVYNQGPTATLMHLPQQNRSGGIPPSLANNMMYPPFPTMATTTTQHQPHVPLSSPQPAPPRLQRSAVAATRAEPMVRIVREISSTSQLQRLQIDAKMERSLLLPPVIPSSNQQQVTAKTITTTTREEGLDSAAALAVGSNTLQQQQQNKQQRNQESSYPDEFTPLFKFNLTIIDESDQAWQVIYEGLACSGQRHVRLSSGWHALMKVVGVIPGDKVVLERWTDDRTVLHMLVLEGNEEQRAAAAAGAVSGAHVRATSRVNLQEERGGRHTRENARTGPRTRN